MTYALKKLHQVSYLFIIVALTKRNHPKSLKKYVIYNFPQGYYITLLYFGHHVKIPFITIWESIPYFCAAVSLYLRNKTCFPCLQSLVKTEANVWKNSKADQLKHETQLRVFTCSRILTNFTEVPHSLFWDESNSLFGRFLNGKPDPLRLTT